MSTRETLPKETSIEWIGKRDHALSRLQDFIPQVARYAARRNYALPGNPGVSRLSPYLRHRLISEEEVLNNVLSVTEFGVAEKFIQEVVWRTYWKGALHRNPGIWRSFASRSDELKRMAEGAPWGALYEAARGGHTELTYFNDWVHELVSTGYLHNHVRMWFASIWMFTFKLPWHLGAAFMYHHLLDGDPASNTLSWRWVAGLHTKGKTYMARADNIATYSEGRWSPKASELASEPFLVQDDPWNDQPDAPTPAMQPDGHYAGLVVTTDDLSIETVHDVRPYASVCLYDPSGAELTPIKQRFLHQARDDFRARLAAVRGGDDIPVVTSVPEVVAWSEARGVRGVRFSSPHVGPLSQPVSDLVTSLSASGVSVGTLQRAWDELLFPKCDKGFFTMWERFKKWWATREA
jgi:deoxyribodipyrimidine photo-lyase